MSKRKMIEMINGDYIDVTKVDSCRRMGEVGVGMFGAADNIMHHYKLTSEEEAIWYIRLCNQLVADGLNARQPDWQALRALRKQKPTDSGGKEPAKTPEPGKVPETADAEKGELGEDRAE